MDVIVKSAVLFTEVEEVLLSVGFGCAVVESLDFVVVFLRVRGWQIGSLEVFELELFDEVDK